jgi:type III restriction enzyme
LSWLPYDEDLVQEISARMDLRRPNAGALRKSAQAIEAGDGREVVCDLATGVGKTYISAALVDYLASRGVRNILIVTPGKTIQDKTVANFTPGHPKYVSGAAWEPVIVTADNFSRGQVGDALANPDVVKLFIFNVQQLIKPTAKVSRRVRATDEFIGSGLYEHLEATDDLVVIADEHHVYRDSAKAFAAAVRELTPRALIGLTATPDEADLDKVIYRYSLAEAIADELVKVPVIVYRQDGLKDDETQLADACHLRQVKEGAWHAWAQANGRVPVTPVLFVVCQNIRDAERVAGILTRDDYLPGDGRVLLVTSQSSDVALRQLAEVEEPHSAVRAVVSVDKLKEGWDVKNIGVIVGLRALASQTLTEQVLGRGLRLPYGVRVGNQAVDTVDLVAHDSYRELLSKKDALLQAILRARPEGQVVTPDGVTPTLTPPLDGALPPSAVEDPDSGDITFVLPRTGDEGGVELETLMQVREYGVVAEETRQATTAATQVLAKVSGAPDITFPRRELELLPERFSLSLIRDADARRIGAAYLEDPSIYLKRIAVTAERGADDAVVLGREFFADEKASLRHISVADVRRDLENRVLSLPMVEGTLHELSAVERVIKAFLAGAGVEGAADAPWSEQRARLATKALAKLVERSFDERRKQPAYRFRRVRVPTVPPRPMPSPVEDRFSAQPFRRNQWYTGWERSVEVAAAFDAKSTEYALAEIFDSSNDVRWWLRTYTNGEAWIEWSGGHYYPDFIVIDDQDVHWVVEGKADDDAYDTRVQAKRTAAEDWARFVRDAGEHGVWRYLFATETMIRQAAGSWTNLKRIAQPEL